MTLLTIVGPRLTSFEKRQDEAVNSIRFEEGEQVRAVDDPLDSQVFGRDCSEIQARDRVCQLYGKTQPGSK